MNSLVRLSLLAALAFATLSALVVLPREDREREKQLITDVVHASIEWAIDKDKELLFNSLAQDEDFFIFHPDSRTTIRGFEPFRENTESFFMRDDFRAVHTEVKDLKVHLSRGGDVAWYSCTLDDFNEFQGRRIEWKDVRWTGVLEKRDDRWVIVQMHFSFGEDQIRARVAEEEKGD